MPPLAGDRKTARCTHAANAMIAAACCTAALTAAPGTAAQAVAAGGHTATLASSQVARAQPASAAAGSNLLVNPGAQAGAFSARGWDAVTIPGWQILSGLPTVVRYGTQRFPPVTGRKAAVKTGQLFAGGAGGTARLRQVVSLRSSAGTTPSAGTAFRLSADLGGSGTSSARVTVTFADAAGHPLGTARIGPAGGHGVAAAALSYRGRNGSVPAGSVRATVVLTLATTLTNINGPYSPYTGYDRGVADNVRFSVAAPVKRAALAAPPLAVPRFQHVFLFYFENEDYHSVIGNTRQAPFLNSLLPHGSLLSNLYAEEHPSDGNYLALAGGSTFGIPLTDPLEENSQYTIRAPDIGDLAVAAHESWKAYLQSANGPCDDTVHGYYWDDDMPMTYFADVRDRPAYCAAHLLPLQAMPADLARAATTPDFAWVSPDDCSDMEGCGIAAGDGFLRAELGAIMRSPAWRTQRSLAIITFDEDGADHQRPAQRVATVMIGSAGVRRGYVSRVRYTHYSLLRTIEAALGLGPMTANDRFAQPVNDVFLPGQAAPVSVGRGASGGTSAITAANRSTARGLAPRAVTTAAVSGRSAAGAHVAAARAPRQQTAFVVNSASGTVSPVNLVTRRAYPAIRVGRDPRAIAITPAGATAYVVNSGSDSVTPIATATRRAAAAIPVGRDPQSIAIAPDGATAYVTNAGSDSVTPIDLASGTPGPPIPVGAEPQAIAITPDGTAALVLNWGGSSVTPVRLRTGRAGQAGRPVRVGSYPFAVTVAPDGSAAYVANYGSDTVTPVVQARDGTWRAARAIPAGQAPDALAITPDGSKVLAVGGDSDTLTPISVLGAHGHAAPRAVAVGAVPVGYSPAAVAVPPPGRTAFVVNTISGTLTPVTIASGQAGRPVPVGLYSYPTAIDLAPAGALAVVVDSYGDQITVVNTSTRRVLKSISVGSYPVAAAIAP